MSRHDITPQIDPSNTDRYIYNPPDLSEVELSVSKALAAAHARKLADRPNGQGGTPLAGGSLPAGADAPPTGNTGGKYRNHETGL